MKKGKKSVLWNVLSWVLTIIAAVIAAMLINTYLIRTSQVNGASMLTNYTDGELVFLTKVPYVFGDPEYEDVVVFDSECFNDDYKLPNFFTNMGDTIKYNVVTKKMVEIFGSNQTKAEYLNQHKFWIKRVIGVAGDTIEFKDGLVWKNGEILKEDYIREQNVTTNPEGLKVTVPEGYVFVMGDNRNDSLDCRFQNGKCVPVKSILGKVITKGKTYDPGSSNK